MIEEEIMAKKVIVLTTPSCAGCATLEKKLDKLGVKYKIIDVTKKPEVLQKWQMMAAPGLVVDGKLVFAGVPSDAELKKFLGK